jgi:hypothetical protein
METSKKAHGNAKLTAEDVLEIRKSSHKQAALAIIYNVNQSVISRIITRHAWKHI